MQPFAWQIPAWMQTLKEEPAPSGVDPVPRHGPGHALCLGTLPWWGAGRIIGKRDREEPTAEYSAQLMGHLRNHLSSESKQKLLAPIEDYRQGCCR
jgi:hypothetical protein